MRKVVSLAAAFLVTLSISGCAIGNNRVNDRNRVGNNNNRIETRRLSGINFADDNTRNYRDGVYTGRGDGRGSASEMAVVEIRNGRIVDIDLLTASPQQGITNNIPGTGNNNQRGNGTITNNQGGTNNGTVLTPGAGKTTGTGSNNQGINYNQGSPSMGMTTGDQNGIRYGAENKYGNGTTGNSTLDGARNDLVRAMIQNQDYDVNINNNNTAVTGSINNWKLAVRRALAQARR